MHPSSSQPRRKSEHSGNQLANPRTNMSIPRSDSGYQHHRPTGASASTSSRYRNQVDDYLSPQEEFQLVREEIEHVKDKSVHSTRNALRRLRETEEVASASLRKLDEQSEKLSRVEAKMTQAEYHAHAAENKTQELQKLNRNFIVSTFSFSNPFTKSKRKEKELEKKLEAERAAEFLNENIAAGNDDPRYSGASSHVPSSVAANTLSGGSSSKPMRSRAFRLDDEKHCEKEDEIDRNLEEISDGLSRLKQMGLTMTDTIEKSTHQITRIDKRTEDVHDRVRRTDTKLQKIAKK